VFSKWELDAVEIGRVTEGGELTARLNGEVVARVPVEFLAEAPKYRKPTAEPAWLAERRGFDPLTLPEPADYGAALVHLLAAPTIASKEWAFRQYDQQVGINTLVLPGSDAAVLRVKGTRRAVLPTPVIGVVGVLDESGRRATQWFKGAGHRVALLGPDSVSLGGSEYLWTRERKLAGALAPLDLETERRVQRAVRAAVSAGLVTAAHD